MDHETLIQEIKIKISITEVILDALKEKLNVLQGDRELASYHYRDAVRESEDS